MFWLRFFGSRIRDSNATTALAFGTQETVSKHYSPLEETLFDATETRDTFEEPNYGRSRCCRRSAIDLSTSYSLDIGPHEVYRLSFDTFANPGHQLTSLLKGFTDFQTLHRGSHARILKAVEKTTYEQVIFKLYSKSTMSADQLEGVSKEIEILKVASKCGTVELQNVFEDDRLILLNLKQYSRGTLMALVDDFGGVLREGQCAQYLALPLLKILCKLHAAGYVHRDIKPEHILFDEECRPYLCDFFAAGIVGRDAFTDREGSLSYMAPELVIKPTPEEIFHVVLSQGVDETDMASYNEKVDVWSLGVVLVEALTGMLPFVAETAEGMVQVHKRHFTGEVVSVPLQQLKTSGQISFQGLDFLSKIFQQDPNDRATASSLLCHPWLQQSCD